MSKSKARDFINQAERDPALRKRVEGVEPSDGALETLVAIANEAGYPVGADDLRAALAPPASDELGEDELDQVAGGAIGSHFGGQLFSKFTGVVTPTDLDVIVAPSMIKGLEGL